MTDHFQTKIRPCRIVVFVLQHCRIKNILTSSIFLLFSEKQKDIFGLFKDFQGPRPKFKDFPGPGNFFPQFQGFPGFSRPWQPCQPDRFSNTSFLYTGFYYIKYSPLLSMVQLTTIPHRGRVNCARYIGEPFVTSSVCI